MFVIIRHEDEKFVAVSGSDHSYTSDLRKAQIFPTQKDANKYGVCGNESVRPVSSFLQGG